ncbi:LamG-like jellyroll fold domain-containing protein [Aeoliella mucimassa]|uniref:FecR protein n=1 Tax=Aeoliella mucimassa TaxID=2527972 RepID=A0A518AQK3_9BACT|nr:LamG-like jellyroll fold domain-containing protein [Aeoliella mucimassa]QDU56999.1 FecR protein [Aeoliella mucimassa]
MRHELSGRSLPESIADEIALDLEEPEEIEGKLDGRLAGIADLLEEDQEIEARKRAEQRRRDAEVAMAEEERRRRMEKIAKRRVNRRPEPIEIPRSLAYAVAAALVIAAYLGVSQFMANQESPVNPGPVAEESAVPAPTYLAWITDSVDAKWEIPDAMLPVGDPLPEGPLKLSAGVVELETQSGAQLVVEAPARFRVMSGDRLRFDSGRVVGRMPYAEANLTIETLGGTVRDLGTEFGVVCDVRDQALSVHVFEGEIELTSSGEQSSDADELHASNLIAGDSAECSSRGGVQLIDNLNEERFVRSVAETAKIHYPNGPYPDRFPPVTDDLVLWLAADGIVGKDQDDRVWAWGDLRVGDNSMADDAWQPEQAKQPLWIADAIGGKPALRFDGKTTEMATNPFTTADNQSVFVVTQIDFVKAQPLAKASTQFGLHLLNYHGPPHIVLECTENQTLRGRVFSGSGDGNGVDVAAESRVFMGSAAVVLAYVYDHSQGEARMYQNGELVSTGEASVSVGIRSSKTIGCHYNSKAYFVGDIAEIAIYNTALSDSDTRDVAVYLGKKYAVDVLTP